MKTAEEDGGGTTTSAYRPEEPCNGDRREPAAAGRVRGEEENAAVAPTDKAEMITANNNGRATAARET